MLSLLTLLVCLPSGVAASGDVARELAVREAALFPEREVAPEGDGWTARFDALEALARRTPGVLTVEERERVRRGLTDEHVNVRAAALRAHGRHGLEPPESVLELVADPHPSVRAALARALAHRGGPEADAVLLLLSRDGDAQVAREARARLLTRDAGSLEAQLDLLGFGPRRLAPAEFLEALGVLELAPHDRELEEAVRLHYHSLLKQAPRPAGLAARAVQWDAAAMAHRDLGWGPPGAGADARPFPGMENLWLEPFEGEEGVLTSRREDRLREAALRAGVVQFALDLFYAAERVERGEADGLLARKVSAEDLARVDGLRRLAVESLLEGEQDPERRLPAIPRLDWSEELQIWTFGLAGDRIRGWPEQAGQFLRAGSPELREAACDAFARTWARTGDAVSQGLLLEALEIPELAARAYRGLVGVQRDVPEPERVARWWAGQELESRLALLARHERGRPYPAWREALIDLWATGEARTVSVPELLAGFAGDEEVRELLRSWALAEIVRLEEGQVPAEEVTRGPWREAEARAEWLLAAWVRVARREHVDRELELLLRVAPLGKELGKLLVADLVKSEAGRTATRALLAGDGLSRRLRHEVLLANTDITAPQVLAELFLAYDGCDAELKGRILRRAAGVDDEVARALLLQVALDPGAESGHRVEAVTSLVRCGEPARVAPLLARCLEEVGDYDAKRAAVVGLGQVGGFKVLPPLYRLYDDDAQRDLLGDVLLPAMVAVELRTEGKLGRRLAQQWRGRAALVAGERMRRRFRGERLPSPDFEYQGWLEAAGHLAGAGQLEPLLRQDWFAWDGRLLMELAQVTRESGAPQAADFARRIDRAALVALLGEGEASDRPGLIVRCRARLLEGALRAEDWAEAHAWVQVLLDDRRAGRTTENALRSVFGSPDRDQGRDPSHRLLALEALTRGQLALADGDLETARSCVAEARSRARESRLALLRADALEGAIEAASK